MLTWGQLQFHNKPCGLLNVSGYFDHLLAYLEHSSSEGFLRNEHRDMLLVDDDPQRLLNRFKDYRAPTIHKWTE